MNAIERCLLYAMSVVLGAVLLFDRADEPQNPPARVAAGQAVAPPRDAQGHPRTGRSAPARSTNATAGATTLDAVPPAASSESFNIVDAAGRPRIQLAVGPDGQPVIALSDETGRNVLELRATSGGGGFISLHNATGKARLEAAADGGLSLELLGQQGASGRLSLAPEGHVELLAKPATAGVQAALRTRSDGSAEITVGGDPDAPGPDRDPVATLMALPDGQLELRMSGKRAVPGPAIQLFADSTAQLTVNGPGGQSGPSLIRFPDGTSVVAVRRADGEPGASMVVAPDQTAVIATMSPADEQAEMRTLPNGKATIRVVPTARPEASSQTPSAEPAPERHPRAPAAPAGVLSAP